MKWGLRYQVQVFEAFLKPQVQFRKGTQSSAQKPCQFKLTIGAYFSADPENPGICAFLLTLLSSLLILLTLPFSLCMSIKVCDTLHLTHPPHPPLLTLYDYQGIGYTPPYSSSSPSPSHSV